MRWLCRHLSPTGLCRHLNPMGGVYVPRKLVMGGGKCKHFSVIKRSREMRNLALSSAGLRHSVEDFVAFSDF